MSEAEFVDRHARFNTAFYRFALRHAQVVIDDGYSILTKLNSRLVQLHCNALLGMTKHAQRHIMGLLVRSAHSGAVLSGEELNTAEKDELLSYMAPIKKALGSHQPPSPQSLGASALKRLYADFDRLTGVKRRRGDEGFEWESLVSGVPIKTSVSLDLGGLNGLYYGHDVGMPGFWLSRNVNVQRWLGMGNTRCEPSTVTELEQGQVTLRAAVDLFFDELPRLLPSKNTEPQ